MIKNLIGIIAVVIFLGLFSQVDAATQTAPEYSREKSIPYKTEAPDSDLSVVQILGITLVMLGLAWAVASALKKYHPQFRARAGSVSKQRVEIIERHRLSHKTFLYLVEFDGKPYLLAQCSDQLTIVSSGSDPVEGCVVSNSSRDA